MWEGKVVNSGQDMVEGDRDNQPTEGETEAQLSPEAQRASGLLNNTEAMLLLLENHWKRTNEVNSKYYDRNDPEGKEIKGKLEWHIHRISQIGGELKLTRKIVLFILTGGVDWEERPENVRNRLEHSKKHHGLENILDT